ncbi:hypothetical protein PHLCEN_2v883 [Hermanssonia centrifuga]|uniref:Uncharacterized protein n=1 Tax=Hermanssonia centrifuga TaxID=98765 RepID=A0A2R6S4S0_9APHY|nr:hypothetical protein PHLCEN_2v883 [Hermanssonia centrifuga]
MSKNREFSITTEHSTSSMPGYPIVKLEGDGAALLFEDNSTVVEEPTPTEGAVKEEHGVKDEDTGASVGVPSTSRSSSTDMKPSPSPGLGGGDDRSPATPIIGPKPKIKVEKAGPQLIGDLPRAEEAAMRTFVEIQENHYQYGTLGRSREALESMTCDCQYEHGQ